MYRKIIERLLLLVGFTFLVGTIVRTGVRLGSAAAVSQEYIPSEIPGNSSVPTKTICDQLILPKLTQLPPDKAQSFVWEYQGCLDALKNTPDPILELTKKAPPSPVPTTEYRDERYRRIAGDGVLAYGMWVLPGFKTATGEWFEIKAGNKIRVIAGTSAYSEDSDGSFNQGMLAVIVIDKNANLIPSQGGGYPTPDRKGEIYIIDAQGERLTLVTNDGTFYIFDVASRTYTILNKQSSQDPPKRSAFQGTIIENGSSPLAGENYTITNQWFKEDNGHRVTVLAGKKKGTSGDEVLVVASSIGEPTIRSKTDAYPLPSQGGPYRIFDVRNNQIAVMGMDYINGGPVYF